MSALESFSECFAKMAWAAQIFPCDISNTSMCVHKYVDILPESSAEGPEKLVMSNEVPLT